MKIPKIGWALAGLAVILPLKVEAASLGAVYGIEGRRVAGPEAPPVIGVSCPGLCRPAYRPCLSGSRWYGPYGYICYHYRPEGLPGPGALYGLR